MPRHKKDPALRLTFDLRIPVTADQRELIMKAVSDEANGFAAWARAVLLEAAKKKLEKQSKK
jgi:hypothetical protein